jgi:hypothetical protein
VDRAGGAVRDLRGVLHRAVTAQVSTVPITPPLCRDISAVTAAGRPPAAAAQALLDLLDLLATSPVTAA